MTKPPRTPSATSGQEGQDVPPTEVHTVPFLQRFALINREFPGSMTRSSSLPPKVLDTN